MLPTMVIDVEAVLRRVVADTFDGTVTVRISPAPRDPGAHRAHLTSSDGLRHVRLTAGGERFDVCVLDTGVGTMLFEHDDDAYAEACVLALARVARAYLRGEGRMERRRSFFRSHPVWVGEVDGREWVLGRRVSRPQYPE